MLDDGRVQITLSHEVYDQAAVIEAAQAYVAHLHVDILRTSADETKIAVRTSPPGPAAERVLGEFLNHVLDLSIRRKLGRG
jgi:hypothetical protein